MTSGIACGASPRARSRGLRSAVQVLGIAAILLGSALLLNATPFAGSAAGSIATVPTATSVTGPAPTDHQAVGQPTATGAASGAPLAPRPAGNPPATGRGTFMDTQTLAPVAPSNLSCVSFYYNPSATCLNTTFDPSINITGSGTIGVAYTAFTNYTKYTNCPGLPSMTNNTFMDVAFQSSTNGTAWSSPVYLGNEDCAMAANVTSAWQPSLTSLSNGTFVVAYIVTGTVSCAGILVCEVASPPDLYPDAQAYNALVVQKSYTGGASWTAPQVITQNVDPYATPGDQYCPTTGANISSPNASYVPSIAARGNDVYLAWENLSFMGCDGYTAGVHYVYSTNGGTSWSTPVAFPTFAGSDFGVVTNFSTEPDVIAASNGQVYVAYSTGFNYTIITKCVGPVCFGFSEDTMDVMVANATAGTGTFTVRVAAWNQGFELGSTGPFNNYNDYSGLTPRIAYNGVTGQLYLVYNDENWIIYYPCSGCYGLYPVYPTVFSNSSNGVNWSSPTYVGHLVPAGGGTLYQYAGTWQPTISVDHNGTIDVSMLFFNDTLYPGDAAEVGLNSTDNGASWNGPFPMSSVPMTYYNDAYLGDYGSSTVAPSGQTYYAWTGSQCPTSATFCDFLSPGNPESNTSVAVSWAFQGTGLTLSFKETNLTAGARWSASLDGNTRSGLAGTTLSVSGVPASDPLAWSIPWVNSSYGVAWLPSAAPTNPTPPAPFTSNSTLTFTFVENVLLNVLVNPALDYYYFVASAYPESTYSMSPYPGAYWYPVNASVSLTVSNQAISCTAFCDYANLSWIGWSGTGIGSVNTNATNITVTLGSAVNETANYLWNSYCYGNAGTLQCDSTEGYPVTYHETGLPAGTAWNVTTVANATAIGTEVNTSATPYVNATIGQTPASYTVWTVPAANGKVWVPTSTDPVSPIEEPLQSLVNVSYSLVDPSTQSFAANFSETGLPNETAWSLDVGNSSYAVNGGSLTVSVGGGVSTALNGSPVYTENGVGYYAASVSVLPYVMNTTWQNTTALPDGYTFDGPARVVVHYEPMFWLSVSASGGGNVSTPSRWVQTGAAVTLTATADPGEHFLDWTGAGAGATTAGQSHNATVTIHPTGPVSEFATFRPNPAPTWNVTVRAVGLPLGASFEFTLGNVSFETTNSSFDVPGLTNGTYAFAAVDSYATDANGSRWVPVSWNGSFGAASALGFSIQGDGSIQVNFSAEYALTVSSTPDGTVTPASYLGTTWVDAGSSISLTATPSYHYKFVGWNASGAGSVVATTPTIGFEPTGPVWESATFEYRVFPPPATYSLNVTETGLPTDTPWDVSAGAANASASGAGATHLLIGLNGSYMLTLAPVYTALGTRYVANGSAPLAVTVTANQSASVVFTAEYALTVAGGTGGSVSNGGTTWEATGASVTLTATPASGYTFVSWNGTTASTSATLTVTASGPVNETASFAPVVAKHSSASSTAGQATALGLLVALLVVGLIVGLVLGRRGGGPGSNAPSDENSAPTDGAPEEVTADDTYGGPAPGSEPESPSS
jgi:Divergent InlB B-repeat domain